jgi:Domain of unknown function (DUF4136)
MTMKKVMIKSLLLALPVTLMFSCKPTLKVSSDYDRSANFSSYKTFTLYYLVTNRNVTQFNEERIWNSIREEMQKKGYRENDSNPDIVVNAVSVVNNKKYLSANSNGYGYGGAFRPYGGMLSASGTVTAVQYKEGSSLIDVLDTKTNKLVWEGVGSAEFEKQPKDPEKVIKEAVTKILANFPQGDIN